MLDFAPVTKESAYEKVGKLVGKFKHLSPHERMTRNESDTRHQFIFFRRCRKTRA